MKKPSLSIGIKLLIGAVIAALLFALQTPLLLGFKFIFAFGYYTLLAFGYVLMVGEKAYCSLPVACNPKNIVVLHERIINETSSEIGDILLEDLSHDISVSTKRLPYRVKIFWKNIYDLEAYKKYNARHDLNPDPKKRPLDEPGTEWCEGSILIKSLPQRKEDEKYSTGQIEITFHQNGSISSRILSDDYKDQKEEYFFTGNETAPKSAYRCIKKVKDPLWGVDTSNPWR
jgi:hypothetical protein